MEGERKYPFSDQNVKTVFENLVKHTVEEIKALDNDYVLKVSPTELELYFVEKVCISPLIFHKDKRYIKNQGSAQLIEVSDDSPRGGFFGAPEYIRGTQVDIVIPFEGDPLLWRIRPSKFGATGEYPKIEIQDNEVIISIVFADDTVEADELRNKLDNRINSLAGAVDDLRKDVDSHNNLAPNKVRDALSRKRKVAQSVIGAIGALGIPMKKVDREPAFAIPIERRESPARSPKVATGEYKLEPFLDEEEYKYILEVLKSMSLVIERNPVSFASLDENAIRDHFLIQLNGHYKGTATGETFNASGKTDILIRAEDRNVFIAECKFWYGSKAFDEAINQLLGYLTWRDSKCALLIFNRTKHSTSVCQKMHEVISARSEHRKTMFHQPDGDSRYILVKESDPGREIFVTTQLYDIPGKNDNSVD
jgi:hypothetical protein